MPLYFHSVILSFIFFTHGAAFVQIWTAGLECAARGSLQMQDIKTSLFLHNLSILSGYVVVHETHVDGQEK